MADFQSRNVNTTFLGLVTSTAILCVVGGIALIVFETLRQLRRLPKVRFQHFWKRRRRDRHGDGGEVTDRTGVGVRDKLTSEDWEMGHLYMARQFHATTPTPPMSRWPLGWIPQAIKFSDWFYASHAGMDSATYVRFLRATVYWMTLHTVTTAPVLLAIHIHFASPLVPLKDMSRASLSSLVSSPEDTPSCRKDPFDSECKHVDNTQGRSLLWIHLVILWYVTLTWFVAVWWIGKGAIKLRWRLNDEIRQRRTREREAAAAKQHFDQDRHRRPLAITEMGEKRVTPEPVSEREPPSTTLARAQGLVAYEAGGAAGGSSLEAAEETEGWRQRTLMISNLPPSMRDEASIRRYFEEFLRPDDDDEGSVVSADDDGNHDGSDSGHRSGSDEPPHTGSTGKASDRSGTHGAEPSTAATVKANDGTPMTHMPAAPKGPEPDVNPERHLSSPVQTVVLVRKMNELSSMLSRRQEVLEQLEAAHVKLAKNVLTAVAKETTKTRKEDKKRERQQTGRGGWLHGKVPKSFFGSRKGHSEDSQASTAGLTPETKAGEASADAAATADDVEGNGSVRTSERARLQELAHRLARFSPSNKGHHIREAQLRGGADADEAVKAEGMVETVWEALAEVPRELLDPHQPVTRLSALFRGQTVPTIDYLLTKLNLLTALVTEMRARPPSSYESASTAFVTFRDPRQARMVWRELKGQIVVRVRLAPEVKDLDWERLMRTSFTGDLVRGVGVNAFFWAFTVFWVIPITAITVSLFTVEHLEAVVPGLANLFASHKRLQGFVGSTLPTLIVSLITMAVPEIIFQISKRFQGPVTWSTLYDQCLCRFWKFVICNVVIFFCLGATTVQSILTNLGSNTSPLNSIATAFPTAAPFFVSWLILGIGLHTGFELMGFMIPLIQHWGARKAVTPRSRAMKTLPRNFNRYYWLPYHVLVMTIVFVFGILQPLVIPFGLVYLSVAMVIFKKNLAYTYFRRFNEMDGVVYYTRILRFSFDGLMVAQVVILIFFSVTKQRAVYIGMTAVLIPITTAAKLLGTRLWASQCRAVADDEANALCGIGTSQALTSSAQRDYGTSHSRDDTYEMRSPLDARASGRYPAILPPSTASSGVQRLYQRLHSALAVHDSEKRAHETTHPAKVVAGVPVGIVRRRGRGIRKVKAALNMQREEKKALKEHEAEEKEKDAIDAKARELTTADRAEVGKSLQRQQRQRTLRAVRASGGGSMHARAASGSFLSGYEAIAFHAPVPSEGMTQAPDDDGDGMVSEFTIMPASDSWRKSRRERQGSGSYSTSIVRGVPAKDQRRYSHLETPHESDELTPRPSRLSKRSQLSMRSVDHKEAVSDFGQDDDEEDPEYEHEDYDEGLKYIDGPLVRPHAKISWDDTPNNRARYDNPFFSCNLDPFLWLPRDPMASLDLCDTIEWYGTAFVSSQGGAGHVGEWDEGDDFDESASDDGATSASRFDAIADLQGNEEIVVTGALAQRLEEAEDAEEIADPADSLPRGVMDEYRKAIRRGTQDGSTDGGSTYNDEQHDGLQRETSMRSLLSHASQLRSPSLRARGRQMSLSEREQHQLQPHSAGVRRVTASTIQTLNLDDSADAMTKQDRPSTAPSKTTTFPSPTQLSQDAPTSPTAGPHTADVSPTTAKPVQESPAGIHFETPPATARQRVTSGGAAGHTLTHPRRHASGAASGVSRAESVISGLSGGGRTITMAQALQAEVLEEERRRTIRERLRTRKNSRKGKKAVDDEEAQRKEAEEGLKRANTLMGRHEQAVARRQRAMASEADSTYGGVSSTSRRQLSADDGSNRRGLRDFTFTRSPQRTSIARSGSRGNTLAALTPVSPRTKKGGAGDVEMTEFGALGTPQQPRFLQAPASAARPATAPDDAARPGAEGASADPGPTASASAGAIVSSPISQDAAASKKDDDKAKEG